MAENKNIEDIVNQDQNSANTIDDKFKDTGKRNFYNKGFFGHDRLDKAGGNDCFHNSINE